MAISAYCPTTVFGNPNAGGQSRSMKQDEKTIELRVIETSDVHGAFFPYNFIDRSESDGSLARVYTYVERLRKEYGDHVLLFDNGDILQGQPTSYYYNYVNTRDTHIVAAILNFMKYDAATIGNHDVETGHDVYDRWVSQMNCGVLGANVIDEKSGLPYLKPYKMIEREGLRIAVIGMITPAIPFWLGRNLWEGLHFDDMVETARKWVPYVKEKEHADVVIGLFHSGCAGGIQADGVIEDQSRQVAESVDGFDLILYGHDHTRHNDTFKSPDGHDVVCLDPSCNALFIADASIRVTTSNGKVTQKEVKGKIQNICQELPSAAYLKLFQSQYDSIMMFVNKKIGVIDHDLYARDGFFGSSSFIDFIHEIQLKTTGAQISINAPLAFDAKIKAGEVTMADMFKLYKFENQMVVMKLTGEEIKNHLEMSYDLWTNTMKSPDDHIMLLHSTQDDQQRKGFKNFTFNFDSAAGIIYEVDVTKPAGQKVSVKSMVDGSPFYTDSVYTVVLNSYRGNGGGELLTKGAGIKKEELSNRIMYSSDKDQRYYIMEYIRKAGTVSPRAFNNWKFVPEEWAKPAIERDRRYIFGE